MNGSESSVQYGCLFSTNHDLEAMSCIKFDPYQSLLWYGTIKGRVGSILPLEDTKYTAFPVFNDMIRNIEVVEDYVLSISKDTFAIYSRGGTPYSFIKTPNMTDIQCSHIYKNNNSHVLLRASPKSFCTIDLEQQKEVRVVWDKKKDDCGLIKENNDFFFTCDNKGAVSLRDKQSLNVITDLMAHKGCVYDFDISGNKLMTCGCTWNYKGFRQDMFLKVFDLRTLRPLPVINCTFPPNYCRFLTSISEDYFIYISQNRQVAFSSLSKPTEQNNFFIDQESNHITCIDISPTDECIAFGDNIGTINLLTNSESPVCNLYNYEPNFADPIENYPPISIFNTNIPLNIIPFVPLSPGHMASYWPPQFCSPAIREPQPISEGILSNLSMRDRVGYAPNTRSHTEMRYLNIIPYETVQMAMNPIYANGSEQNNDNSILGIQDEVEIGNNSNIMWQYQKPILPRNSRLTMDMDSERYNKSGMVSLICDESVPYVSCVIQAMHPIILMRNLFEQHICKNDPCLSCELNFQFRLMSPSRGNGIASIKNFVRAFEAFETHRKIHLMGGTLRDQICAFIENLLEITGKELEYTFNEETSQKVQINKNRVFGKLESPKQCIIKLDYSVWNEGTKVGQLIDLINPTAKDSDIIILFPQISAAHLKKIQAIFERGSYWNYINCKHGQDCINTNCRYKHPSGKERIVEKALGELNYEEISLPQNIRIINQSYSLESAIFVMGDGINDPIKNSTHAISIAKDFHKPTDDNINWVVFSGHATGPITKPDAFACNLDYKVPVAVFYMKAKRENVNMSEFKIEIPKEVFWAFPNLALSSNDKYICKEKFDNLEENNIVALDAEFISVDKTDNIKTDEIGRISVVDENEQVIIDDYIQIGSSSVNDYKTSVSGIVESDLNPETTNKQLTTLKVAYMKILYLVEHSFHFIGHGLCNDFNVLNIWVNEIQYSDTVKLCRLQLKPMLPLKKLAFKFLDKVVQKDTHDSIEDAKTALQVYRKYETLKEHEINEYLNDIYNSHILEWEPDKPKAIS